MADKGKDKIQDQVKAATAMTKTNVRGFASLVSAKMILVMNLKICLSHP